MNTLRAKHLLDLSRHYRDQMQAMEEEFIELHGISVTSEDGDDLRRCIAKGDDYYSCLVTITDRHLKAIKKVKSRRKDDCGR